MSRVELLPTQDGEAGYGPDYVDITWKWHCATFLSFCGNMSQKWICFVCWKLNVLQILATCSCMLQSLTKCWTKLGRLTNYSPHSPGTVLKHQILFLGHWGYQHWDRGVGRGSCIMKGFSLADQKKREFQCMKINKITALQRSDFQILFQLILSNIVECYNVCSCFYNILNTIPYLHWQHVILMHLSILLYHSCSETWSMLLHEFVNVGSTFVLNNDSQMHWMYKTCYAMY